MNQPTLAELKAELDQLSKKIAELEKQPKKTAKESWAEEFKHEYETQMNHVINWDLSHYSENSFKVWKQQINLMTELQTFAKLRNGDWVADFKKIKQGKFGITLEERKAKLDSWGISNGFVYGISFPTKEIAAEALEIFGERIEQFYGK